MEAEPLLNEKPDYESEEYEDQEDSKDEQNTLDGESAQEEDEHKGEEPKRKKRRKHVIESDEELARRGIVYVSRMPPGMQPRHLRTLLGEWGTITRIYCAPESVEEWTKRKKRGGNRRRQFKEAWVEFESKRKAYNTALGLNGEKIGARKKDKWYDDVWCLKFLKHFKWYHLTEELKLKSRVQDKMLHMQVAQAKHEAQIFLENREKAIVTSKIQENREAKLKKKGLLPPPTPEVEQKSTEKRAEPAPKPKPQDEVLDDSFLFRLVGQKQGNKSNNKEPQNKKRKRDAL